MAEIGEDIISKKKDPYRKRVTYKGVAMHEIDEINEIEKMDTRQDDIWVCSFPRSGTTLTQELTYLVQTLDFVGTRSVQLDERFPILEHKDIKFPYYRGVKFVEQMTSPRLIKSHLHHNLLPEQLQSGKGRIIYVSRNPKDVVSSFYRFMRWFGVFRGPSEHDFEKFVDNFVNGTELYCPWTKHVLGYWERRNDENILFLKYEDIVKDKPKIIRQIAEFLGQVLTDDNVTNICEYCSVENMKNNPMCNMSYVKNILTMYDEEGGFINEGKSGAWKTTMTPEMVKKIETLMEDIKDSGLIFDEE